MEHSKDFFSEEFHEKQNSLFLPQPVGASQKRPGILQIREETKHTATHSRAKHSKYEDFVHAQLVHVFTKQGTANEHG